MRSQQLSLGRYETDKISHHYLEQYDPVFEPWVNQEIVLLELGIHKGGSLLLWRDYFPKGKIVGIDLHLPENSPHDGRIQTFAGNQGDPAFLTDVAAKTAPQGFDIIIDDASHLGKLTKISFWHLFDNHLKAGGLFIIEDWGTGYWNDWPDGKSLNLERYRGIGNNRHRSDRLLERFMTKMKIKLPWPNHSYGMVGLIKQLIDEQGASDVTRKHSSNKARRKSKFASMLITPSIVFIKKNE